MFGVIPATADQPVFAEPDEEVRFRGEAVAMIVGEPEAMAALDIGDVPGRVERAATRDVDRRAPRRTARPGSTPHARATS